MSALTPEQMELPAKMIPGFKGSLFDYLRSHMCAEVRRIDEDGCAFWQGLSGDILAALLAAAESVGKLQAERDNWIEEAKRFCRGEEFYRDIVRQIGEPFGVEARTSDDGSIQDSVLALKVPELVASLRAQLNAREQENAEQATEINRLEKVVVKFIVADVQRSANAMMSGDKELQDTLFFVDTQRMKAVREKEAAEAEVERMRHEATRAHEATCCPSHATDGWACVRDVQEILGKALGLEFLTKDEWLTALASSQPPQTTEKQG